MVAPNESETTQNTTVEPQESNRSLRLQLRELQSTRTELVSNLSEPDNDKQRSAAEIGKIDVRITNLQKILTKKSTNHEETDSVPDQIEPTPEQPNPTIINTTEPVVNTAQQLYTTLSNQLNQATSNIREQVEHNQLENQEILERRLQDMESFSTLEREEMKKTITSQMKSFFSQISSTTKSSIKEGLQTLESKWTSTFNIHKRENTNESMNSNNSTTSHKSFDIGNNRTVLQRPLIRIGEFDTTFDTRQTREQEDQVLIQMAKRDVDKCFRSCAKQETGENIVKYLQAFFEYDYSTMNESMVKSELIKRLNDKYLGLIEVIGRNRSLQEIVNQLIKESMNSQSRATAIQEVLEYEPSYGATLADIQLEMMKAIRNAKNVGAHSEMPPSIMLQLITKHLPVWAQLEINKVLLDKEFLKIDDNSTMVYRIFEFLAETRGTIGQTWTYNKGNKRPRQTSNQQKKFAKTDLSTTKCYNCQQFGHKSYNCPQESKTKPEPHSQYRQTKSSNYKNCWNCGKDGHPLHDCPVDRDENRIKECKRKHQEQGGFQSKKSYSQRLVKKVQWEDQNESEAENEEIIDATTQASKSIHFYLVDAIFAVATTENPNYVRALFNAVKLNAMIDSGSDITIMSESIARRCNLVRKQHRKKFRTAEKNGWIRSEFIGKVQLRFKDSQQPMILDVLVFPDNQIGKDCCIVGTDFISQCESVELVSRQIRYLDQTVQFGTHTTTERQVYEHEIRSIRLEELQFEDQYDHHAFYEEMQPFDIKNVQFGKIYQTFDQDQKNRIHDIFYKYKNTMTGEVTGDVSKIKEMFEIDTTETITLPTRQVSLKKRKIIDKEIDKMLKNGIIRSSNSDWASPVVLVRKPDRDDSGEDIWRFCIDYRQVNSVTTRMNTPIPNLDNQLQELLGYRFFSGWDFKCGFWNLPIRPEDIKKTAFVCHRGCFEFVRMPFGLTNAPRWFQRCMNKWFHEIREKISIYLDDLLAKTKTIEEHIILVEEIFKVCERYGLQVNLKKSIFFTNEIDYLGYFVTEKGIEPQRAKLEGVRQMTAPTNAKEVSSFLGALGGFRKFIRNYTDLVAPLQDLTRKFVEIGTGKTKKKIRNTWHWGELEETAFQQLKIAIVDNPLILAHPDPNKPYQMYCDASNYGLGCALFQEGKMVDAVSKRLKKYQLSYEIREKELAAIILGLDKMDSYLDGAHVEIFTDHKSLENLEKLKLSPRLIRWIVKLMRYDFTVTYLEGENNHLADALSRMMDRTNELKDEDKVPMDLDREVKMLMREIMHTGVDQRQIRVVQNVHERTINNELEHQIATGLHLPVGYHTMEGQSNVLLFEKDERQKALDEDWGPLSQVVKNVIFANEKIYWLRLCHNLLHRGVKGTYDLLQQYVTWSGMYTDTEKFVQTCLNCQLHGKRNQAVIHGDVPPIPNLAGSPLDLIQVDIKYLDKVENCEGRTIKGVLSIIDVYTGYVEVIPLNSDKAPVVGEAFYRAWALKHGLPNGIVCDNGSALAGVVQNCIMSGVTIHESLPHHARSHGLVERSNQEIGKLVMKIGNIHLATWLDVLPRVVFGINCSINSTTGKSPYELVYGAKPKLPNYDGYSMLIEPTNDKNREGLSNTSQSRKRTKLNDLSRSDQLLDHHILLISDKIKKGMTAFSKRRQKIRLQAGDVVRVAAVGTKSKASWSGPYVILARNGEGYMLSNGMLRHVEHLCKVDIDPANEEVVQSLMNKVLKGKRFFVDQNGKLLECKEEINSYLKDVEPYDVGMAEYWSNNTQ